MSKQTLPELRPVEIRPFPDPDEDLLLLQDPEGLSEQHLVLTPMAGWLIQFLDGNHTLTQIDRQFRKETGRDLPDETVDELIGTLDKYYFLNNSRALDKLQRKKEQFLQNNIRPATLTKNGGLPSQPERINNFFQELLGKPTVFEEKKNQDGFLVPHIDYPRGRSVYRELINHLASVPKFDRVIILGTAHSPCPVPFSLINKPYETAYGEVPIDQESVGKLQATIGPEMEEATLAHRLEHSIEIPLTLIQYIFPDTNFHLVPILCSFAREDEQKDTIDSFSSELESIVDDKTLLIGSVDFAHVGPQFGDRTPVDDQIYDQIKNYDNEMIEHLINCETETFEKFIQEDNNPMHVCGYPVMRTVLPLFNEGELIHYDRWKDPFGTVSFGALGLKR